MNCAAANLCYTELRHFHNANSVLSNDFLIWRIEKIIPNVFSHTVHISQNESPIQLIWFYTQNKVRYWQNYEYMCWSFSSCIDKLFLNVIFPYVSLTEAEWRIFASRVEWFIARTVPSHHLNQCWIFFNWTLKNKLQWRFNRNSNTFIQ